MYEELSFFNQQLAGMLKSGLPLEASLRQIAATMQRGDLRNEVEALERDLAQGAPLEEAIGRRRLPELYTAMVRVGVKTNDLPAVLTMVAGFYRALDVTWTRLKGLLVYPGIVLVTSVILTGFLAVMFTSIARQAAAELGNAAAGPLAARVAMLIQIWLPVAVLTVVLMVFAVAVGNRRIRYRLRWRLPGFREASLAQFASSMALMLENGSDAGSALQLVANAEQGQVRTEMLGWRERIAAGAARFMDVAKGRLAPPLFVWLVASAGENWAAGFRRAAEVYSARANHRIEVALYVALPVAILIVAALVMTEVMPVLVNMVKFMNWLGDVGGVD